MLDKLKILTAGPGEVKTGPDFPRPGSYSG